MGWERLVAPRITANMSLVREFYHSIDADHYRAEGVMVRGVRVLFNEHTLNRFFGTLDFPDYFNGFPNTNDFIGPMSASIAEELRIYPMQRWRGKKQRIDHRELSTDLAFWNDFVSHVVSPRAQYQKLRDTHPKIILCINRAERFDLGTVMCRSMDWHLKHKKQLVFPCTITALCQLASIEVTNEYEDYLKPMEPMGSKIFARMAGTRVYSGYYNDDLEMDGGVGGINGAENQQGSRGEGNDGFGAILQEIRDGHRQIINRLDGYDAKLQGFESCLWEMGSRLSGLEDYLRRINGQAGIGNEWNHGNVGYEDDDGDNMVQ